ncbi:hypothetical protein AB0M88_48720, partial [Actinoplanes sp. NPDC051411]
MPFARIATAVTVTLLVGLAGCGHDPKPSTVAAPAAAVTDVPLEGPTGAAAGTELPPTAPTAARATTATKKP